MIHQYKLNGKNIVLDIGSGAIHIVDSLSFDIIELYETMPSEKIKKKMLEKYALDPDVTEQEISNVVNDIETLKKEGKLFSDDDYHDAVTVGAGLAPLAKGGMSRSDRGDFTCPGTCGQVPLQKNTPVIKALCLHVAHACNLTCDYCFAKAGKYLGEDAFMSFEVGKQALDFLVKNSGNRRNLEVDFFGGEPLMNWDVVKELVAYARSLEEPNNKNFRFTLTTNGILIDDDVTLFANKEMNNVVLSLDGRMEVHNHFRKTINGQGSYEIILPKFQKLVKARGDKSYYIRGTFTHNNVDFTKDILHMADLGFKELSMEPVVCSPNDPYALTKEDLPKLFKQYELLAKEMAKRDKAGNGFTFYHFMIDLEHGPCIYKRITGCGSGTEYLAVTPTGELYPCHQFVGDKKYLMGDVWKGVTNTHIRDEFSKCNVYSREKCKKCWARFYCSGGCAANSYHAAGNINDTYDYGCELFRKRIECAIWLKIELT